MFKSNLSIRARRILSVYDAAAMAATYGSISIVTFPFNMSVGIPLYYGVISRIWA